MKSPKLHRGPLPPIPFAPVFEAGYLASSNDGWSSVAPVLDPEKCNGCMLCALCCPDGAVRAEDGKVRFERDFCKGCGLCVKACRKGAISLRPKE
jgi:2-oxoacid:acceptor oxidoreductase delta subunit (pyruvate/2-ketoisovalerate family)